MMRVLTVLAGVLLASLILHAAPEDTPVPERVAAALTGLKAEVSAGWRAAEDALVALGVDALPALKDAQLAHTDTLAKAQIDPAR